MTSQEGFEKALSLKAPINAAYDAVLKAEQNSLNEKIKLGELLILAKEAVGHGAFGTWLEEHTKVSHRSANVYMQLAERKDKLAEETNSQRAAILAAGGEMSVRWQTFCSTDCRQAFHRRKYRAEAVEDELNGKRDRGTKAQRQAAKAAISAFTQGLRRPVEVTEPAQPLRRRF